MESLYHQLINNMANGNNDQSIEIRTYAKRELANIYCHSYAQFQLWLRYKKGNSKSAWDKLNELPGFNPFLRDYRPNEVRVIIEHLGNLSLNEINSND